MSERLGVRKTWKLYVGGKFPRSESGRYDVVENRSGGDAANVCRASRKDLRDAVQAARGAQRGWAGQSAFLRSQILYRVAEMLDGRRSDLLELLAAAGSPDPAEEFEASIARWVHYAGWCDKFSAVLGTVNPVAGPYFNFSLPEPSGVLALFAPEEAPLLALSSLIAPAICGGNAVVAILSTGAPLPGLLCGEVFATSDLPGGVVNLLSARRDELLPVAASHRDVDGLWIASPTPAQEELAGREAADNLKRVHMLRPPAEGWSGAGAQGLDWIERGLEIKTVWHTMQL